MSSSDRGVGLDLDAIEARKLATLNALIVAGRALGDQASITQGCVTSDVWATKQALRDLKNDRDALVAEVRRLREALGECHGGDGEPHRFEPGIDVDMVAEGRSPDPRWCNVCGETRAVSS